MADLTPEQERWLREEQGPRAVERLRAAEERRAHPQAWWLR